jgi:3-hydroxyisobutyrate dehydrogenase-like beta-hydroxyacid dehydrogenase
MGIMGQPMALNLVKSGYEVTVFNRTQKKTDPLASAGAGVADAPAGAAEKADALILMVTGPDAVDALLYGRGGVAAAGAGPGVVINMSTVPPAYSRNLAERLEAAGIPFLEAPVAGTRKPAETGDLVILTGGDEKRAADLEPVFMAMGKKVIHCGETGKAAAMKLTLNLLLGVMMEGIGEALNFGRKAGLSQEMILNAVLAGPLGCTLFSTKAEAFKADDFPPQFPFKHMLKDLRFVLDTARETDTATPACGAVAGVYERGMEMDLGDLDMAAAIRVLAAMDR